jgi:protein-disulfide isomerase
MGMSAQKALRAKQRQHASAHRQRRRLVLVGAVALMFVAMIASVALVGRGGSDATGDVRVSRHPAPASAEPRGRAWGPADAPIKVVEYADYECESCGYWASNYEQSFVRAYAGSGAVRFEVHFTPFHGEGAARAAQGAYCAAEQNMFWPFHDSLFLNQPAHGAPASAGFTAERLGGIAAKLNMDTAAFNTCLTSGKYAQQVADDLAAAQAAGVTGTPTFVVNDRAYTGPIPTEDFASIFAEVAPDVPLN